MRTASSANATCCALASASEYTATVAIPSLRAVRITRQAISPRFAIRIRENTLSRPGGLALLEEGSDAFSSLRRHADLGNALCRLGNEGVVDRMIRHRLHELLDARERLRTAGDEVLEERIDRGIELGRRDERSEEAEAVRLRGVE